ncbi:hypothetical protein [Microvirga sp. TS319]|uniref:hypothetical protein n=1 Tax=Microvirga sp. TS319 TaxID=3241165 RepID=UPI00351A7399
MQSIFLGRVASAEYIPFTSRGGVSIITYEVSDWFKGSDGPHARIVWYPAIPCVENCPLEETVSSLEADRTTAFVFAEPLSRNIQLKTGRSETWDGENRPCGNPSPLPVTREALPGRSSAEYDEVLFRNALRSEIEILKKERRS